MGGHGAWSYSVRYPDTVICSVPAAGWLSKEHYADSNRVHEYDLSQSYSDSALQSILFRSVLDQNVELYYSNLAGIPILARVGLEDKTVSPYFTRRMVRLVSE